MYGVVDVEGDDEDDAAAAVDVVVGAVVIVWVVFFGTSTPKLEETIKFINYLCRIQCVFEKKKCVVCVFSLIHIMFEFLIVNVLNMHLNLPLTGTADVYTSLLCLCSFSFPPLWWPEK